MHWRRREAPESAPPHHTTHPPIHRYGRTGSFNPSKTLALKAKRCVIIPLDITLDDETTRLIKEFLRKHATGWAAFAIQASAEYLGFIIGP